MIALPFILLTSVLLAEPVTPPANSKKEDEVGSDDRKTIQGIWTVEAINQNGKVLTDDPRYKGATTEFTKEKALATDGTEKSESEYSLNPSFDPKRIDFKQRHGSSEYVAQGIYKLEENTLTICFAIPGKDRPADFKPGEGRAVMILKRKQTKDK